MQQWMLRITAYAERLLDDLDGLEWPDGVKDMQRNWIGKSTGAEIAFAVADTDASFQVFTTRPDTLFGCTYCVLSPEHPLVARITSAAQRAAVDAYVRTAAQTEAGASDAKTGVFSGAHALHPVTGARLPIWIADYVLMSYGHGAIMAVPAHDERDHAFAVRFGLPITEVVAGGPVPVQEAPYVGDGRLVNSQFLDGLDVPAAKARMIEWLEAHGKGTGQVQYRLRDWLFSRQRYWGEPFPIVWVGGEARPLPEEQLPIQLPETDQFKPSGHGDEPQSPLAAIRSWVETTDPASGKPARRETNTMPQWAGSCWYYLRFLDPHNDRALVDPAAERYWMPVDLYIGGGEHAVLHLLYARFWHKVLFDIGVVSTPEPFMKLIHQGTILGEDMQKMSKSRGNVVNPDDLIEGHGADAVRLYEMFMGPLEASKPWSPKSVEGVSRFLDRVWRLMIDEEGRLHAAVTAEAPGEPQLRLLHRTIRKVTGDLDTLAFNTAIAQMMEFVNEMTPLERRSRQLLEPFVLLLAPFAPHLAEELWSKLGKKESLAYEPWPAWDPALVVEDRVTIAVQVNGKLRATLELPRDIDEAAVQRSALADQRVRRHLDGAELRKVIFVPNKLLNLVVAAK